MTPGHADVLVIGAGPAGMAAASAAAKQGRQVVVLDDNQAAGGQIWRQGMDARHGRRDWAQQAAREDFRSSGAILLAGRRVVDAPATNVLRTVMDTASGPVQELFAWDRLIMATGARERFLPFPGWTLPGVLGAGGLQALVKGGYPIAGKRVVIAGTGPLLLAVAVHLQEFGAKVVCVAEQANMAALARFAAGLWAHPGKVLQGARYRAALASVPYRIGWWPSAVDAKDAGLLVQLTDGKRVRTEQCDLVACGFHLVPNTEVAALLGCRLVDGLVEVNAQQETSTANVFCAGEPTGIAGLESALIQGSIAGLVASGAGHKASALISRRANERRFGEGLTRAFALRPEVCSLAAPDTIVCRCEDVTFGRLQEHRSWTGAKLQTRCGMGACQGRICGPAVQALFGWQPGSVRPPLFPVPISTFSNLVSDVF